MLDPKRIRQARQETGLSQKAFAEKLGKCEDTVRGYEAGRRPPPDGVMDQIVEITGWRPEEFVRGFEIDRERRSVVEAGPARSYDPDEAPVPGGLQRLIDMGLPLRPDELQTLVAYSDPMDATRGARGAMGWTPGQWLDVLLEERRKRRPEGNGAE
jgi:transcriptional regulator with XRE-family HTH domain